MKVNHCGACRPADVAVVQSLLSEVRAFSGHVERLLQEREKISLQDGDGGGAAGGDQSEDVDRTVTGTDGIYVNF